MSDLALVATDSVLDIVFDARKIPYSTALSGGLSNAVYLSVFVSPWWGNRISPARSRYTSTVEELTAGTLTQRTARNVVEAIRSALRWMISDGIAQAIDVTAELNGRQRLDVRITITEPDQSRTSYAYGLNWAAQSVEVLS